MSAMGMRHYLGACLSTAQEVTLPKNRGTGMDFLIVFAGGGLGAALRHGVNLASARLLGLSFPYATLFENVTGSLVMGLLAGYFAFRSGVPQHWRLFLTTGILGGYTTFSAFSLDAVLLYERGAIGLALLYAVLSVALSIGGLFVGLALVRQLT
jgi:CrcB protein